MSMETFRQSGLAYARADWKMTNVDGQVTKLRRVCIDAPVRIFNMIVKTHIFVSSARHGPVLLGRPYETAARYCSVNRTDGSLLARIKSKQGTEEANWIACPAESNKDRSAIGEAPIDREEIPESSNEHQREHTGYIEDMGYSESVDFYRVTARSAEGLMRDDEYGYERSGKSLSSAGAASFYRRIYGGEAFDKTLTNQTKHIEHQKTSSIHNANVRAKFKRVAEKTQPVDVGTGAAPEGGVPPVPRLAPDGQGNADKLKFGAMLTDAENVRNGTTGCAEPSRSGKSKLGMPAIDAE
ncbi:hypothetical protein EX30DRAFT_375781 [Ascodesmis nigricans]|uniref:Uncharacterized protein n=1 Tax=Ascodesmis nigricans TaxID=341454 RepID=A0A4S2MHC5_9PEZI|nr:hypothetical protein EX30DRAFT_375781 [Ascodesmis nigricans]